MTAPRREDPAVEARRSTEAVHFLPYGAYVASCGRIEDQRHPKRWSDLRRDTTCAECQAQMTDRGDLPPTVPATDQPEVTP